LGLTQRVSTRPQRYSIPLTSANTLLEQNCYILPLSVRQHRRRRAKFKETRKWHRDACWNIYIYRDFCKQKQTSLCFEIHCDRYSNL